MPNHDHRPFVGRTLCKVVLPVSDPNPFSEVESLRRLIIAEAAELAAEVGCPTVFAGEEGAAGTDCTLLIGPATLNPAIAQAGFEPAREASIHVDRERAIAVVDGPTISGTGDAFQLLRTAFRSGDARTKSNPPTTTNEVLETLRTEVWETYPAFGLRDLKWPAIFQRHEAAIRDADASLPSLQRLFAELQDAHSWVKDRGFGARLPYRAWIKPDDAWFTHVPTWSAAWAAGVRPGDRILSCDRRDWWERTSATPRTRALTTGYRWLSGTPGSTRLMKVTSSFGNTIEWDEELVPGIGHDPIAWHRLHSGTGYLRIRAWFHSRDWASTLERALTELADCPRLLVDLRGNAGGNLIAAQGFRDRFLTQETELGSIQFSIGNGRLADPAPLIGRPPVEGQQWHKPVRFLIDRQSYSATEDAILGLGGQPHVQIVGEPSGGGSGRPRTIHLRDGMFATISTALTFDRNGHCVEANGVPVDIELPIEQHHLDPRRVPASEILHLADQGWDL